MMDDKQLIVDEHMERLGRHLAEQQGKSVARLAGEYRRYAEREGKGQRHGLDDPPEKFIVLFIALDILGDGKSPRKEKQFRDAFRHIANGTHPPVPTRFREEDAPIFFLVLAKLMEISRDGTLLDPYEDVEAS
ncbi:MAG: hypothetical protein M3518_02835 [Actinomycetota bacterium]|nr:hypothetical protein [Actinomycetota bacterium]